MLAYASMAYASMISMVYHGQCNLLTCFLEVF